MKASIIIILSICLASCFNNYKSGKCAFEYSVSVGENLSISQADVETAVSSVMKKEAAEFGIDILIFGYSAGKEVFSYTGSEDKPAAKLFPGKIDSVVKIKVKNEIKKTVFISASGNNKDEILSAFALKLRKEFCE